MDLQNVSVFAELERAGWAFQIISASEIKCVCPFHDDVVPSCSVNVDKRVFKCFAAGCGRSGDILTLLAGMLKTTRAVLWEDVSARYGISEERRIDAEVVERYHKAIWGSGPFLRELYARGLTDDMIREHRIGYGQGRITIPVVDENGAYVNVRRYLPGAPSADKMRSLRGRGHVRLYPVQQLKHDTVVLCGGELKAIVAAALLNDYKIGAVCTTGGEGGWSPEFSPKFRDKRVYVCMDVDRAGSVAAYRLCTYLYNEASWLGIVRLPLSVERYPHGDVNDWVGRERATAKDFKKLLDATEAWVPRDVDVDLSTKEIVPLRLVQATRGEFINRRIAVQGVVAAVDPVPYVVPKRLACKCDRAQKNCQICPLFPQPPNEEGISFAEISPEAAGLLETIAAPKKQMRDALAAALRLPVCKSVTFSPIEYFSVTDVRLTPQLEIANRSGESTMQPAYFVGTDLELNTAYEFKGRVLPDPKTQQAIMLSSSATPVRDALSVYSPTQEELDQLLVFQPKKWTVESVSSRLESIYADLSANVTHIYQRTDLHLFMDFAWHSPLLIAFDGQTVKGWVEVLIVGDSSQGKSDTAAGLMRHYGLGEKVECKNASVAGLLGGLQQIGGRWMVTWGVIPTHDRRLVVLEELKGTSPEVISKLTDMRSSGVAEIPKIEKRRTHARTRLIGLSNPRSDRPISAYNFGVDAIKELVGGLEDIRRFDACLVLAASQIDAAVINRLQIDRPTVEPTYLSEACRGLILWAWTRDENGVRFEKATTSMILRQAIILCDKFSDIVPIVDKGSMRYKLARLSAALAARTFSCDEDRSRVIVRPCHAEYVYRTLDRVYSEPTFGYADFSAAIMTTRCLTDAAEIEKLLLQTPFPADVVEQFLYTNDIELRDVCDWCGWDRTAGLQLVSFLVRKHAMYREGRSYRKSSAFIDFLKTLQASKKLGDSNRPPYVKEDF